VRWLLRGGLLLFLLVSVPTSAMAQTPSPSPSAGLSGHGTVAGDLAAGSSLVVQLQVEHGEGWQHIQEIDVDLVLRGSNLERLQYIPTASQLSIIPGGAPVSLGQQGELRGQYFSIDPSRIALTARGNQLRVRIPMRVRTDPPAGARMTFEASAVPLDSLGPKALTPPVKSSSGFSWGALGLAIAVALFAGGFFGNVFGARRRRPSGPSVYGAIQKKLAEQKAPAK
jgi:hypothetical protein